MVAITTHTTARSLALPARPARPSRPSLHLVRDEPGANAGAGSVGRTLATLLVALVAVAAIAFLALSDPAPLADGTPAMAGTHVVAEGESMLSIARDVVPTGQAGIYVERLVAANGTSVVEVGQVLQLPIP